jgi:hypothetical protein
LDAKKDHETKDIYGQKSRDRRKVMNLGNQDFLKPKSAQNSAILLASLTMVGIRCQ